MLRFASVGVANILISLVVYYLAYNHIAWLELEAFVVRNAAQLIPSGGEGPTHLRSSFSNFLAYLAGMGSGFLLHKLWTFRSLARVRSELPRFIVINVAALALSTALLHWLVDRHGMPYLLTWVAVIIPITGLSYLANRYWAFAARSPDPRPGLRTHRRSAAVARTGERPQ